MGKKNRLFACIATLGLLAAFKPVFAAAENNNGSDDAQLQKVMQQTSSLEHQMKLLKAEIRHLKAEQKNLKKVERVETHHFYGVSNARGKQYFSSNENTGINSDMNFIHNPGSPIVISSYLGEHTAFDASDLIINYSDYNESLNLLRLKQKVYRRLNCDVETETLPFLMMSGKVEGLADYQKPSNNVSNSNISLEDAELDIAPVINNWASGFISLQYFSNNENNAPPKVINNARVHLKKGFITFGDLELSPVYFTMGQWNMPFGQYSSPMISSPLTQDIFQTRAQAILLGYAHQDGNGLYAQTYAFNGDTQTNRSSNINNIGANVGYVIKNNRWNTEFGVGAIGNIADSLGMQQTGAPAGTFGGFSVPTAATLSAGSTPEKIQRQVAGLDAHATFGVGSWNVIGEYERAASAFNINDMMFNGRAAQPQALDLEGSYSFHVSDLPVAFSIGYGRTWDALALNLPESRYIAALTTSFWKDTIEELEFRHDINYNSTDSASGLGVVIPSTLQGFSSNTVTAQLGIYF